MADRRQTLSPSSEPSVPAITLVALAKLPMPSPKKLKTDCDKCVHKRKSLNKLVNLSRKRKQEFDDLYIASEERRALKQPVGRKADLVKKLRTEKQQLRASIAVKDRKVNSLLRNTDRVGTVLSNKHSRKKHQCKYFQKLRATVKELNQLKKKCNNLKRQFNGCNLKTTV